MTPPFLRMITVCVDYWDLLALTLPWNIHHFKEVMVVTSLRDEKTQELCDKLEVQCFITDLFYRDGARFNKWLALETALDFYGREGWICIMDADILWPKDLHGSLDKIQPGVLYTPRRRMYPSIPKTIHEVSDETLWKCWQLHRNEAEFAGYSQIFHADDPALGDPPWHQLNWTHSGGADSYFQLKWKPQNKIRPAFEVLHLGEAGVNWCGRSAEARRELMTMLNIRRGKSGPGKYDHEKIQPK